MATNRISVLIDVMADGANRSLKSFKQSIADADTATGKFKAGASSAFDSVKANAGNLALAAGAGLVAFGVQAVGAFRDTALAAGKLRDSLGVTAEEASRLMEVAEDLGIGTETLERSIGIMNRTATNTPAAFEAIGAELKKNADGTTNVNETFLSTIDALKRIPDASARAAAAQKVFGRGWMEMAELIELGATGVRTALDSVEGGKIIDDEGIEDARAFRDSLDALRGVSEELSVTVGSVLVPALTKAADATLGLRNAASGLDGALGPVDNALVKVVKTSWEYLNPVGQAVNLLGRFRDSNDDATEALEGQSHALVQQSIDSAFAERATRDLAAAEERATANIEAKSRSMDRAREAILRSTAATVGAIDADLGYRQSVESTNAVLGNAESSALDVEAAITSQAAASVRLAEQMAEVNGRTLTASDRNSVYRSELEKLVGQIDGPAADAIRRHIEALGRIPASVSTSIGVGGRGPTTSVNGYRASGGPVSAGGTYVVGEEGPELLQMGSSSGNVIPNGATVGGGTTVVNLTVNGADPNAVIAAIRKYVRTNGPVTGIT